MSSLDCSAVCGKDSSAVDEMSEAAAHTRNERCKFLDGSVAGKMSEAAAPDVASSVLLRCPEFAAV